MIEDINYKSSKFISRSFIQFFLSAWYIRFCRQAHSAIQWFLLFFDLGFNLFCDVPWNINYKINKNVLDESIYWRQGSASRLLTSRPFVYKGVNLVMTYGSHDDFHSCYWISGPELSLQINSYSNPSQQFHVLHGNYSLTRFRIRAASCNKNLKQ